MKPTSGYWEEPYWSLGVLPNSSQSVLFTNSNWKALAIGPSTAMNFSNSMTVGSLTIRGAWDTFNTLLLQYAGTAVPLTVLNGVTVQDTARILNFDSAFIVQGGTIVVTNAQIVQDGGFIRTTNAPMYLQNADYHLTNGVFEGGQVLVGWPVSARFNQYGGRAVINDLQFGRGDFGAGGHYTLYGGELFLPNGMTLLGGNNAFSSYVQSGGTNRTTTVFLEAGLFGVSPGFTLNGGLLVDNDVTMLGDDFGSVAVEQNGGTHIVSNALHLAGGSRHGQTVRPATYRLNGGTVSARIISLDGHNGDAYFIQSNGIAVAEVIQVSALADWYFGAQVSLSGGTLACSNLSSGDRSSIFQSGGALVVSNTLSFQAGSFAAGTLVASNINARGYFIIGATGTPRITNPGTCTLSYTLQISNAVEQLGRFILASDATIDLAGNASRLSFANSRGENWSSGATLTVTNWNGNPSGGGADQLKFGNNQSGLTPAQLNQIRFRTGSSFYSAKILNTGEVVPNQQVGAPISFSRQGNNLMLTWPSGWSLQSATNVIGPYIDITGATSPYSYNMISRPQQFFRLHQQP